MSESRPNHTFDENKVPDLENWIGSTLKLDAVKITDHKLLSGGAIGENWRLNVRIADGDNDPKENIWVLRTDAPTKLFLSHNRGDEFELSRIAFNHGVMVPKPVINCLDENIIGAAFMISAFAPGTANGRKITRDPELTKFGNSLAHHLGGELAKIHKIKPTETELAETDLAESGLRFLKPATDNPARAQVALLRQVLDHVTRPRPALEFTLSWLDANAPPCDAPVLCHGDFRTGNYLVDKGRLIAIMDWEFALWGDRHLDIGWFCARCWRFGKGENEAGGIGTRKAFYAGYNSKSDRPLNPDVVPYWQVMAAARWGAVALLQAERHLTGGEESLELLLTGNMAPEIELEALRGIEEIEKSAWKAGI